MNHWKKVLTLLLGLAGSGCTFGTHYVKPTVETTNRWYAPLPHDGKVENLEQWWTKFNDPTLQVLLKKAQDVSPNIAQARLRIAESQAQTQSITSNYLPTLDLNLGTTRNGGSSMTDYSPSSSKRQMAESKLSINPFGAGNDVEAAKAKSEGAIASWHVARIQVAADLAQKYIALRACEKSQLKVQELVGSLEVSVDVSKQRAIAGFSSPTEVSSTLSQSSQMKARLQSQSTECSSIVKALVALTSIDENELRRMLHGGHGAIPTPSSIAVNSLPISVIDQRPDVIVAERDLAAAHAEIGEARSALFPRFSLVGSIGYQNQNLSGTQIKGSSWSFGPSLDIPLFDYGRRKSNVNLAISKYENALSTYKAQVRTAVKEVEDALNRLDGERKREIALNNASAEQVNTFASIKKKQLVGFSSINDLEVARRSAIEAELEHIVAQRETAMNWINLYLAVYGGWESE